MQIESDVDNCHNLEQKVNNSELPSKDNIQDRTNLEKEAESQTCNVSNYYVYLKIS